MRKRGQGFMGVGFGMIFSIIIIIAILGVGFYVIQYFLGLNNCTQVGYFYDDLQDDVDRAWRASISQEVFSGSVPSGIDYVCFGNFTQAPKDAVSRDLQEELEFDVLLDNVNVFLYPLRKACDGDLAEYNLRHVKIEEFFCLEVQEGKIEVNLEKTSSDALVFVGPGGL
jgi:hypothetical protein